MPISVVCSACNKTLKVADTMAGKAFKCPGCQSVVRVATVSTPTRPTSERRETVAPEEESPVRKERRDEDREAERPARKSRREDRDEEDDRPRKKRPLVERLEEPDEDLAIVAIDLEDSNLPDHIRDRIEQELTKGEKLYWVGMPSRRIVLLRSLWGPIVGVIVFLLVLGFFVLPGIMAAGRAGGGGLGMVILPALIGMVVCGGLVIMPFYNLWRAGRTCYALTSRRAIVWQAGLFGGVEMENYNPARLASMWRRDMWIFGKGGGDLVFRSVTIVTVTSGKHGGVSRNTTYYGFLAIENVRKVERLVREVLVDKVIDRMTS